VSAAWVAEARRVGVGYWAIRERNTGIATVARVLLSRITAMRSLKGSEANSSCIKPNFGAVMDGALIIESVPGGVRGCLGDGVKKGDTAPVVFEELRDFFEVGKNGEIMPVVLRVDRFLGVVVGVGPCACGSCTTSMSQDPSSPRSPTSLAPSSPLYVARESSGWKNPPVRRRLHHHQTLIQNRHY
jgi:hypothetical protein